MPETCLMCRGALADPELMRVQVWEDDLWRLTASTLSEVPGFCYLEPKRHIPFITDLDGDEARTFGPVLARITAILKEETSAELVYVQIFGGSIPHLHVHLAPHREGDALNDALIKGEIEETRLPNGLIAQTSKQFPPLPESELRAVADRVARRLAG